MTTTQEPVTGADLLDDEMTVLLGAMPPIELSADVLSTMRDMYAMPPVERSGALDVSDHEVPGTDVVVRVARPGPVAGPLPGILWIHGGGYIIGSFDMEDARWEAWCPDLGFASISVEYRLAPEHPYPAALEDCYAALTWAHDRAEELALDPARLGIGGLSAGGGLAAALGIMARDRGELGVAFQLLESPMLDDRQVTPSSQLDGLALWSRESNTFGWRCYLGDRFGSDDVPATAAAARCGDLSGLPPTLMIVGGADGFRDEDVDYATRLAQAGVPTDLVVLAGLPHGVSLFADSDGASRWADVVKAWLARRFAPT